MTKGLVMRTAQADAAREQLEARGDYSRKTGCDCHEGSEGRNRQSTGDRVRAPLVDPPASLLIPDYEEWLGIAHSLVDGEYPARGSYEMKLARCVVRLEEQLEDACRERDAAQEGWDVFVARMHGAEASVAAAREALREIESLESDNGTFNVVWDGVRQWVPEFKVIARAGLNRSAEKRPGDSDIGFGVVIDE